MYPALEKSHQYSAFLLTTGRKWTIATIETIREFGEVIIACARFDAVRMWSAL
jgi:hypothetical protein